MDSLASPHRLRAGDGLPLSVVDFGGVGRPEILLVHGSFGHARVWDPVAADLAAVTRTLAVDLPGHGDSGHARDEERYAFAALVADLVTVVAGLDLRPVVVGHSIGSAVAMTLAATHGDLLAGVVLIDIDPHPPAHQAAHLNEAGRAEPKRYDSFVRAAAREARIAPEASPEIQAHLARHAYREENGVWVQKFDQGFLRAVRTWDCRPMLRHIAVPALVLRGEGSSVMSHEGFRELVDGIPGAKGSVIPGASHQVHLDAPAAVASAVAAFLDAIPGGR